jgi:hypothetical protein
LGARIGRDENNQECGQRTGVKFCDSHAERR